MRHVAHAERQRQRRHQRRRRRRHAMILCQLIAAVPRTAKSVARFSPFAITTRVANAFNIGRPRRGRCTAEPDIAQEHEMILTGQ